MDIIFLGGIFVGEDRREVIRSSKGVIQYAADNLQKSYIQGFLKTAGVSTVTFINLPFIGSYPLRYTSLIYRPKKKLNYFGRAEIRNFGFINLSILKNLFRFLVSFRGVLRRSNELSSPKLVICYSMHLPFLLACALTKILKKDLLLCTVVPDLPEYMALRTGWKKYLFSLVARVSYSLVNRSDIIVVLTDEMLMKFRSGIPSVVIEGMADEEYVLSERRADKGKHFLYSGTLDRRYGLRELVDSFLDAKIADYELHVCGDGDDRAYIESLASKNSNLRYFGQLEREDVLSLQRGASLLINPRSSDGEYTKYSFPSKTIEYMSSGTPVLMYRLPGVPEEYFDYCFIIPPGQGGIKNKLIELAELPVIELENKGRIAKRFIKDKKMPALQAARLLNEVKKVEYV